ncbi:MAG TPA: hypothetical protein VFU20_03480, partial [Sphingomicrobium sp.]|nr:hypothetical protein [Sphingomicrobium sp.]
ASPPLATRITPSWMTFPIGGDFSTRKRVRVGSVIARGGAPGVVETDHPAAVRLAEIGGRGQADSGGNQSERPKGPGHASG